MTRGASSAQSAAAVVSALLAATVRGTAYARASHAIHAAVALTANGPASVGPALLALTIRETALIGLTSNTDAALRPAILLFQLAGLAPEEHVALTLSILAKLTAPLHALARSLLTTPPRLAGHGHAQALAINFAEVIGAAQPVTA